MKVKSLSRVRLLATPWTAAHQAPPSMGFSRQEYWSGVPSPSPDGGVSDYDSDDGDGDGDYNDSKEKDREGNGTPLQYSCLENPMDGGAW